MRRVTLPEPWRGRAIVIADARLSDDWFNPDELEKAAAFRLEKRMAEWKLSRIAAKQLAMDAGLCASPRECVVDRPLLQLPGGTRQVSIAHSAGYAGAAIDVEPVGIDIEKIRDLEESTHLFLSENEEAQMRDSRIAHRMIHFWAAKEAAWKRLGGATATLKRVALKLEAETASGLRFDKVETFATGEIVIALTRPISSAGSSHR